VEVMLRPSRGADLELAVDGHTAQDIAEAGGQPLVGAMIAAERERRRAVVV